jgi:hypothetical protein
MEEDLMADQQQLYTCGIVGQAVTLAPKAGSESKPTHLGASTVVVNTVANPAPAEFWNAKDEYLVVVHKLTRTA